MVVAICGKASLQVGSDVMLVPFARTGIRLCNYDCAMKYKSPGHWTH